MKKFLLKPGFEFIFSISFIAILCLPPLLMAQTQKDLEIKIENGDTTVNGKKLQDLSVTDRQEAMKDINHLSGLANNGGNRHMGNGPFYGRRDSIGGRPGRMGFRRDTGVHRRIITENMMLTDTLRGRNGRNGENRTFAFKSRNSDEMPGNMGFRTGMPGPPMMRFERRNSESFNYTSTDDQGIPTRISFRVSEPVHEDLQKISGVEGAKLEINDLSLVPEFTAGKTVLMFSLSSKALADVYLKDGDGKLIWNEKLTGGNFMKAFLLPMNGIYYLHIKQGHSVAVKKIVKEE